MNRPRPTSAAAKEAVEGQLRYLYLRWLLVENLIRSIELYAAVGVRKPPRTV
ncbi:MAG: hypothetical protein K6T59_13030 [Bryobacteraceae bacterium]|jgi:hypothetical protein|nr:hypothetical protein [Bryobacteraceae bacterium]